MCARFTVLSDTPIPSAIAGCVIPISRHSTIWMRSRCAGGNFQCRAEPPHLGFAAFDHLSPESDGRQRIMTGKKKNTAPTTLTRLVHKNLDSSGYGGGISSAR